MRSFLLPKKEQTPVKLMVISWLLVHSYKYVVKLTTKRLVFAGSLDIIDTVRVISQSFLQLKAKLSFCKC